MSTFSVSPGVSVSEFDQSATIPAVSTTVGAFAGIFNWGPVNKTLLIDSENSLAAKYGKPSSTNYETWFTAANFLAYSNALYISRAASNTVFNAIANTGTATVALHLVNNEDQYLVAQTSFQANVQFIAKFPGDLGNSLKVSVCDSAAEYKSNINLQGNAQFVSANSVIALAVGSNVANIQFANNVGLTGNTPLVYANTIATSIAVGDVLEFGNTSIGKQYLRVTQVGGINVTNTAGSNTGSAWFNVTLSDVYKLSTNFVSSTFNRQWEFTNRVDQPPGQSNFVGKYGNTLANDEIHIVVSDIGGKFTGVPGTILEIFQGVSRATDAKLDQGGTNFYKTVINQGSNYIWAGTDLPSLASNTAVNVLSSVGTSPTTLMFNSGTAAGDESAAAVGDIARAYDFFKDPQKIDISLLLTGKSIGGVYGEQLGNYLIDNIAEVRKDCVVFISAGSIATVNNLNDPIQDTINFFNGVRSSSYAFFDSSYKYQYDRYNDINRWIPANGDTAGLCVNTDNVRDPWFSPAGFNRGFIKNCIKLAVNPNKASRDLLYKNRVNPLVTFPGQGTVLFGDKTGLAKPSAFDRINVRRLFIVLEKAIAIAAQSLLFEINDEFSRANFKNIVEPFLRDIQGRRGIYDFRVICDTTNNTGEVIDGNRFVGDVYVKPSKSINTIQLNFVAVRSDATFNEISN